MMPNGAQPADGAGIYTAPPQAAPEPVDQSAQRPTTPVRFTDDDRQFWDDAIKRAAKLNTDQVAAWGVEDNLKRYTPRSVMTEDNNPDMRVNVAKDFSDVERKRAALFFQSPKVALVPDAGTPSPALLLFAELLNQVLGPKRMRVKDTALAAIQDCLVAIQPVPTEIGYTAVTADVPVPVTNPLTQQPVIDPRTQQPQTQLRPIVVWEDLFWSPISPRATLLPAEFRQTRYDDAPWIGYRWRRPVSQVRRQFKIADDVPLADNAQELPYFRTLQGQDDTGGGEAHCTGVKIWYRATLRDPAVTHPLVIRELVRCDGLDEPPVHQNLTCQTIGPDGRLTPDSMIGYPLHPLALRRLTDAAYVAADCTITGPLTNELNKFRTTVVQRRDGSKNHILIDSSAVDPEVRQKIGQGNEPMLIPVQAGALAAGADKIMAQVPALNLGRESYIGQDIIERDRAQVLGVDANQVGASGDSSKTATEITTVQRNADARFEQERQQVVEWWLAGVQKVAALILRYGDRLALEILGPERGQEYIKSKMALGPFSYEVVVDSGNYTDLNERKRQDMQLYNMTAQDPKTHHEEVLVRLAADFGIDPARWIVTQKPEEKPDPAKISISVKPEDLDPALPSYVGTYAILTASGVKGLPPPRPITPAESAASAISAAATKAGEATHGGMSEQAPMLNKHQIDESGERSGPPV